MNVEGAWPERYQKRNAAIYRERMAGYTLRAIGKAHKISATRVHDIVRRGELWLKYKSRQRRR